MITRIGSAAVTSGLVLKFELVWIACVYVRCSRWREEVGEISWEQFKQCCCFARNLLLRRDVQYVQYTCRTVGTV